MQDFAESWAFNGLDHARQGIPRKTVWRWVTDDRVKRHKRACLRWLRIYGSIDARRDMDDIIKQCQALVGDKDAPPALRVQALKVWHDLLKQSPQGEQQPYTAPRAWMQASKTVSQELANAMVDGEPGGGPKAVGGPEPVHPPEGGSTPGCM